MTIKECIQLLETGGVTSLDLVEQSIAKIEKYNKRVNSVVETCFSQARHRAAHEDFSKTHFKGMPVLIKALGQSLKGQADTASAMLFKDHIATNTSAFVQKLEDLGMIVVGQTNAPEFGFKNITDSVLYGDAHHPVHGECTPGGSSGGAGAAAVFDFTPIVAASDGGGSIRIPASYCGLVGHKPTRGTMPVGPSYRGWQGASMNFFLTKNVNDTRFLFDAMYTQQDEAPFMSVLRVHTKNKLKIAYTAQSPLGGKVSQDAKAALDKTVNTLKRLGHELVEVAPNLDGMAVMWSYYFVNGVETASMFKGIEASIGRKVTMADMELVTWVLYQYGLSLPGYAMVDALHLWDQTSAIMHQFHQQYDIFITPTTTVSAPQINEKYQDAAMLERMRHVEYAQDKAQIVWDMFDKSLSYTPYTMLANITGQPAISLPMYRNPEGKALGVQLMAAKGCDALLFDVSKSLEPFFEMYEAYEYL